MGTVNSILTERQLAALVGELGWDAEVTDNGEVAFESGRGYRVWLSNYGNDTEYVHMHTGFGLRWFLERADASADVGAADVQLRLLRLAADLTRQLKGVKVMIMPGDDMIILSVEGVIAGQDRLPSVELLAAIAPRLRSMIRAGVDTLLDEIKSRVQPTHIDLSAWEAEFAQLPPSED